MRPIADVAKDLGVDPTHLEPYGLYKAKVALKALNGRPSQGRLILVSAITPTPAGEGKTTCSVGLAQGLGLLGVKTAVALREPSLGPYLGMKGGGTGGGCSQVIPADDVNLHFTGDIHAVSAAHNLLAAVVDNHLHHGNPLGLDSRRVLWRRVVDMNDRALRDIVIGLGGHREGVPRETGFDIAAASEVMAILCLADGIQDFKQRLGRIVIGFRSDGSAVQAADLKVVGAMAYPVFLAGVGFIVLNVLIIFFVPRFETIFKRLDEQGELPALTIGLMAISRFMQSRGVFLLAAVIAGIWALRRWMRSPNAWS